MVSHLGGSNVNVIYIYVIVVVVKGNMSRSLEIFIQLTITAVRFIVIAAEKVFGRSNSRFFTRSGKKIIYN